MMTLKCGPCCRYGGTDGPGLQDGEVLGQDVGYMDWGKISAIEILPYLIMIMI